MSHTRPPAPLAVGAALILLGIGATAASFNIALDQYGRWGARVFPLAGSLSLLILGVIELRSGQAARPERKDSSSLPAIVALLCLSVAYVWVMGRVGYLISTGIAAPLALWIFGIRNIWGLVVAAILCPLIYHLVFFVALGVFPPYGDWFDLLDVLQVN